jgi:hypothetical protein
MKRYILSAFAAGALFFSGCSSKQYFEPENTYAVSAAENGYSGVITKISRDGATLADGHYLGKRGISTVTLAEGYRFLSENDQYVLSANEAGSLRVTDKRSGKMIKEIMFDQPVVSAGIRRGLIAYILNNNAFGLYSIQNNKKIMENRSERTFAIDVRAATPLFIDTLVVMPMLDGKLVIFDVRDPETVKVVYLSSEKVFNNIIYLSRTGDTLVAATPKKILTLGSEGEFTYRANIAEVAVWDHYIYLFSKEGEIIKFNILLEEVAKTKFAFAQYSAATVIENRVYALDKQGSLIVLDTALKKYKIYDAGKVESPVSISGNKLYKDGTVIHLDKLGYE